jgi:hypothetical protein
MGESGEVFKNHPIAFLLAANSLNIELIDTPEKQCCGGYDVPNTNTRGTYDKTKISR